MTTAASTLPQTEAAAEDWTRDSRHSDMALKASVSNSSVPFNAASCFETVTVTSALAAPASVSVTRTPAKWDGIEKRPGIEAGRTWATVGRAGSF
jgi:hypothetical protein